MIGIFLFFQLIICILLIGVILIQKNSSDSIAGIGGGANNVITARALNKFMFKTSVILVALFLINSIILANLSTKIGANKTLIESENTEK